MGENGRKISVRPSARPERKIAASNVADYMKPTPQGDLYPDFSGFSRRSSPG
jgi:hypothetical protein